MLFEPDEIRDLGVRLFELSGTPNAHAVAVMDHLIECPKHNGRFDVVTGEAVRKPAKIPLGTYKVEVVDGNLVADLTLAPDR